VAGVEHFSLVLCVDRAYGAVHFMDVAKLSWKTVCVFRRIDSGCPLFRCTIGASGLFGRLVYFGCGVIWYSVCVIRFVFVFRYLLIRNVCDVKLRVSFV